MTILFWVILIVFSIVKTKIIHYSSLTYFPMSFLAALTVLQLIEGNWKFRPIHQMVLLLFISLFGSAFVLLGMLEDLKEPLLELLKNDFLAHGNFSQHVPDGPIDPWIGLLFMVLAMGSVVLLLIGKSKQGIIALFGTTLFTVTLLSIFIAPKIDRYTQESLFDFYESKADQAYFKPLGYHTYAHLFYGKKKPTGLTPEEELRWLVLDKAEKPVYFIVRAQNLETQLGWFPHLEVIDKKGGYLILERTDENYPFRGER